MSGLLIACAGFLAGILWMDLLFDTQILRRPPQEVVGMIGAYYENATLLAFPLNRLIALIMIATVLGSLYQLLRGRIERRMALAATGLSAIAVGLALARVVPNAMRLGARPAALEEQIELARTICFDHMICLTLILAFIAVQITGARARR